jgi:hypothetical protein
MDQVSMSPPDALPDIANVLDAGDTLVATTPRLTGDVTSGEGGIGAGTLGQAFRAQHVAASQQVLAAAATLAPALQQLGENGRRAVLDYQRTDAEAANELRKEYRHSGTPAKGYR